MRTLALSAVLALIVTGSALAAPRPGALDRGFGGNGRVETPVSGKFRVVVGVESLPGGKVLVVGTADHRLVLIRYRGDGSLDRSFGRKGIATFDFGRYFTANDTVLDSQGRLLVVGTLGAWDTQSRDAALLRFDSAGRLDPTLDQDGIALVDFGGPKGDDGYSVAVAANEQIVLGALVAGPHTNGGFGIARLDPAGVVDLSFGERGFVVVPDSDGISKIYPNALAVLPDGGVVAGLNYSSPKGSSPMALKLLASGAFDASFSDDTLPGWRSAGSADASLGDLVFDAATNRIVISGSEDTPDYTGRGLWLNTFNLATGSFQRGDLIVVDRRLTSAGPLAIDRLGRTIVAGTVTSAYGFGGLPRFAYMVVARAKANGKLEQCFGRGGFARVRFRGKFANAAAVAVTPGGKILVAGGPGYGRKDPPHRFQVARLHGGGC